MGKIICLECGKELESGITPTFIKCGCRNATSIDSHNTGYVVSGKKFSKILTWLPAKQRWEILRRKPSKLMKVLRNLIKK